MKQTPLILTALSLAYFSYLSSNRAQATTQVELTPTPIGEVEEPASGAEADTLAMEETMLDDLVVIQQRKLVSSDGATLTYNVSDDPDAASNNILEILRKVPGVTVDAEDNVRVNGQTNFKIMVNGREDAMMSGDVKTVLKTLPAASIKKIEVISEPGAKYDAEGTGGILNFVTETKTKLSGFSATLQGWGNNYNMGASINARGKIKNVMISGDFVYNNSRAIPRAHQYSSQTMEDLENGDLTQAKSKSISQFRYIAPRLNMSWEPDTLNLFTFSAGYGNNPWSQRQENRRWMETADGQTVWCIQRQIGNRASYDSFNTQASYQHSFGRPDHTFVLSYLYEWREQKGNTRYFLDKVEGIEGETPYSAEIETDFRRSHVAQADYSNRLDSHNLIEAGAKISLENLPSDKCRENGADETSAVTDMATIVNLEQFKDIYALYGSYTGTYGKWNVKAGLRYEHTRTGLRYHIGDYPDFTTRLNDWVPNAALSYNISDASALRLAYQMRIWRPGPAWLNPFVDDLTPGRVSYGNPNLKSERINNLSLGYTNYEGKFTGGVKFTWSYDANSINDIIFMKDGVLNCTYANIGHDSRVRLDGNFDWQLSSVFTWGVNASVTYADLRAECEALKQRNHGWQSNFSTNVSWTMPCKVRFSAYGGYYTPWIDLQSRGKDGYYYGLGFNRSFLKNDALSVNISAGSFLPVSRTNRYTQIGEGVRYTGITTWKQWYVGFGVTYRFGGLKADVKRTAASVETDGEGGGGNGNKK